jgi:hypothetical protein
MDQLLAVMRELREKCPWLKIWMPVALKIWGYT